MAYATATEIQEEFKSVTFGASGNAVTTARVERFILEAQAEIDAKLSMRYQLPLTSGMECWPLIRAICIAIVSDRVKGILEVKTGTTERDQDNGAAKGSKWAREQLDEIKEGTAELLGATLKTAANGVQSSSISCGDERTFSGTGKLW